MGKNGMASTAIRDLGTLFGVGAVGGLSDGELLGHFVERREEAVFEAIIHRHGPMVWGVCRRVLCDHHDAEDAFQATFLVLARRSDSIAHREKLGNWLYGVAYQTARKARAKRAKRREGQVPDMPEPTVVPDDQRDDLAESLDRELSRLPEKYRLPIILCDLEGKTHRQAAGQLGWPIGTVSGRLSRARAMLARRLSRPGRTLSVGALAVPLARESASAGVPTNLIGSTARAASLIAAGAATAGVVPAGVAALTGEVMKMMLLSKIKVVSVILVVVALSGTGFTWVASQASTAAQQPEKAGTALSSGEMIQQDDLRALSGTWMATRFEHKGKVAPQGEADAEFTIEDDGDAVLGPAGKEGKTKLSIRIDPSKSPKTIELTYKDGTLDGKKQFGIYKLDKAELTMCLADPGAPQEGRPTGFDTEGKDYTLVIFERRRGR